MFRTDVSIKLGVAVSVFKEHLLYAKNFSVLPY